MFKTGPVGSGFETGPLPGYVTAAFITRRVGIEPTLAFWPYPFSKRAPYHLATDAFVGLDGRSCTAIYSIYSRVPCWLATPRWIHPAGIEPAIDALS